MMQDMMDSLFGKNNPFKNGNPSINIFVMGSPSDKPKMDTEESTLKKILKSTKNLEAGQSQVSHVGGN